MIDNIKTFLGRNIHNLNGWRTNRKIIVFESDDWGSIRMPNQQVYNKLLKYKVNNDPYTKYDSLASKTDLESLFSVLSNFKDKDGNHPVITANTIVANPDFDKIYDSNFEEYYYEPFTLTIEKYFNESNVFNLWKEGISNKVFKPQLHGREHVNVFRWMQFLRDRDRQVLDGFKYKMFGFSSKNFIQNNRGLMPAFDYSNSQQLQFIESSLKDASKIFKETFNYTSKSFIAPNYVWNEDIEKILKSIGISYLQSSRYQIMPLFNVKKGDKNIRRNVGQINDNSQIYLVRNCTFEPSLTKNDVVQNTLRQIQTSFFWKKPAIICSHRLNYIGGISEKNRQNGLLLLDNLLSAILKKWPDVEFMTSDKLGDTILN